MKPGKLLKAFQKVGEQFFELSLVYKKSFNKSLHFFLDFIFDWTTLDGLREMDYVELILKLFILLKEKPSPFCFKNRSISGTAYTFFILSIFKKVIKC